MCNYVLVFLCVSVGLKCVDVVHVWEVIVSFIVGVKIVSKASLVNDRCVNTFETVRYWSVLGAYLLASFAWVETPNSKYQPFGDPLTTK